MALADFFRRDAIAISQVLQGFETDAFIEKLEGVQVAIAFGEEAAASSDGRELLDLLVRLAARLYPGLVFTTVPEAEATAGELMTLAKNINPNVEASRTGTPDAAIAVGTGAPIANVPTVYAGCDGWVGLVGTRRPYSTSDLDNPYGAGFAACLAAANLFRFLFLPEGASLLDEDISFPPDASSFPSLEAQAVNEPLVLVGAGAVGNSAAWALARTPLTGEICIVDPETIELSNLQRYVLCARNDEGGVKVDVTARAFEGALQALPHRGTWASFLETSGYRWERVLVALDSARDRRGVQWSLPRWIVNAWTQIGDLGVSAHSFLGPHACLACLYLPTQETASEDQVMAEGLRIPNLQKQVRLLLDNGRGIDREICEAISKGWGISTAKLEPYEGRPIRDLWVEGVCGGGIVPLEDVGSIPRALHVPLAFQSALAGVLLAAEAVRDLVTAGTHRKTLVRRVDLLSPLGDPSPQPALKAGTGRCICEDQDFVSAYQSKYV